MTSVSIPEPSVIVLVAAAGTGKSTFAARHFAPEEILSSDAFRAVLRGDEADQSATRTAFAILHRALDRRLAASLLSVVDATNLLARSRGEILRRAAAAAVPAVGIVLALPAPVILARNAARHRRVDELVVRRHIDRVSRLADERILLGEGFASVTVLRSPAAVDAVRVVRVPASSSAVRVP